MRYLTSRLKEKSTFFGLVSAVSVLTGMNVSDEKMSAAFFIVSFVLGLIAAGTKENGSVE